MTRASHGATRTSLTGSIEAPSPTSRPEKTGSGTLSSGTMTPDSGAINLSEADCTLVDRVQTNRLPAGRYHPYSKPRRGSYVPLADRNRQRVGYSVSAGAVRINLGDESFPGRKEGQRNVERPRLFIGDGADEPVRRVPLLASHDDIVANLSLEHFRLLPVYRDVADELECRLISVVLDEIGRHLHR